MTRKLSTVERGVIDLEERSIREMVRIYKPTDASTFATMLSNKPYYGTKYTRIKQVVESEMNRMREDVSA